MLRQYNIRENDHIIALNGLPFEELIDHHNSSQILKLLDRNVKQYQVLTIARNGKLIQLEKL